MNNRLPLFCTVLVALSSPFTSGAADRPNILFIMSDDHAAHAISAYGSRVNQTPNLDRLAKEGMRFENCFAV
ncbi:MAG: sulfatase-like hydrolase/transferase, partial [Verrucomicrobia bacterium]|nr:sulfatase-like hydrolase/transferase [Verrucomicrobiota bacterium]